MNTGWKEMAQQTAYLLGKIIMKYTNLRALSWRPLVSDLALTHSVIGLLPKILGLTSLHLKVNTGEIPCSIPPLELKELRHLTLASPSPRVLLNLPEALKQLDRQLLTLRLEVREVKKLYAGGRLTTMIRMTVVQSLLEYSHRYRLFHRDYTIFLLA